MNNRDFRTRVVEVVLVIRNRQQWIHHRDHRSDSRRSKPRPHKLGTIWQHHQHAIFDVHTKLTQRITGSIRKPRYFAVRPLAIFIIKADLTFPTFLQIVIKEVVGHVEPLWKRRIHAIDFSVQPLCSLCLCCDLSTSYYHRNTENTEVAQRSLLVLTLKDFFQKRCERRLIFRAARIELKRKPDVRSVINNLGPEVDLLSICELDLNPDKFLHFNIAARQHKTATATEISNGRILAREYAFPAGR